MIFVKTFKGYEDKTRDLDATVNEWILGSEASVVDIKASLSHEPGGRASSGDLLYTVLYEANRPLE